MRSSMTAMLAACHLLGQCIGHPTKPMDMLTPEMLKDPRYNMMTPKMIAQTHMDPRCNMMTPDMIAKMHMEPLCNVMTSEIFAKIPPVKMPTPKMAPAKKSQAKTPPVKMPPLVTVESPGLLNHIQHYDPKKMQ